MKHNTTVIYSRAPISEVVFGVTFNSSILSTQNIIFDLISELKSGFPIISFQPPIADEELKGFKLFSGINIDACGPGIHQLRNREGDKMVQLQWNKVYLNWIRGDQKNVGTYPGFVNLMSEFLSLFDQIAKVVQGVNPSVDILRSVKYYELLYQDRFIWLEYISTLKDIKKIVNISPPTFLFNQKEIAVNNIFSNYTIPIEELGGYAKIALNTGTSDFEKQLFIAQIGIQGDSQGRKINEWFNDSHNYQIAFFEQIFTNELLKTWK